MTVSGYKVDKKGFVDLSDYARPLAVYLAGKFKNTSVHAYHITLFHFGVMLGAVYFVSQGGLKNYLLASILLLIKNVLDSVDGSLARLQNRPSRVGRFLDSNLDFMGNLLLFLAFRDLSLAVRLVAFLFFILQGSIFNYYYILFRQFNNGDKTSQIKEDGQSVYSYDNPLVLKYLYIMYVVLYDWQDKLVDFIECKMIKKDQSRVEEKFLSYLSTGGLGFQYLIIIAALLLQHTDYIVLWFFGMNIFVGVLLFYRAFR